MTLNTMLIERVQKYVKVNDNWHSNYNGDQVLVTLTLFDECVHFNAWGMDDMGVEMYHSTGSKEVYDVWKKYIFEKMPDVVNEDWFLRHGFYPV